ncbi:hypothetical protein Stube_03990 [Streptomyces tubercidicus]|uniref:Uncharacterized protein n=1 Tax=Streptomyces tubercidicus TaxID=47759 RepID=A0A640UNM3_9ACTN|nr:hypothetical protein Stube_03990 [Streptomyces tubercidicus]
MSSSPPASAGNTARRYVMTFPRLGRLSAQSQRRADYGAFITYGSRLSREAELVVRQIHFSQGELTFGDSMVAAPGGQSQWSDPMLTSQTEHLFLHHGGRAARLVRYRQLLRR